MVYILMLFASFSTCKIAQKHSAEVLASVPKHNLAVRFLIGKRHLLALPHLNMSYATIGWEVKANLSTTCIKYVF